MSGMYEALQKAGEGQGLFRPAGAGAAPGEALRKLLAPEARRLFTGIYGTLLASAGGTHPRFVLVCSASDGEGATTVAAGLAVAAAERRSGQVLLIDGNCHSPAVCHTFGVSDGDGLGDLLAGTMEAGAVVRKTAIAALSVMGAGVIPGDHILTLEPPRFRGLLERIASNYHFILVDGPAINAHPESVLYASQVDRVLLVVHAGVSRGPVVAKALAKLSPAGRSKVEVVLNRRIFAIPQAIYKKL
ncbi:MAG: CpsD/CapB family tyrosine-protein kinase [Acidobacteria bacterium]|nr:CpsD/CapB family tyrosine-protein kinase [Acidobacteriota bacterium]